jgi:hypothetical protein
MGQTRSTLTWINRFDLLPGDPSVTSSLASATISLWARVTMRSLPY